VRSHCNGYNKDKIHNVILTDIMISVNDMPPTSHYLHSAFWCLVAASLQVSGSNTMKSIWKHIVK